jgi:hypothetical protein
MPTKEWYEIKGETTEDLYQDLLAKLMQEKYGSPDDAAGDDGELTVDDILNAGGQGKPGDPNEQSNQGQGQDSGRQAGNGPTYCGSGAGNAPLSNEADLEGEVNADSDSDSTVPGWEKTRLQRSTAEAMKEWSQSKGIGSMPGDMLRWVEEFLAPPAVDWVTKLRNKVADPLVRKAGVQDYTWNKLPKHNLGTGIIMPRTTGYELGKVGIFVDTSGSMSQRDLAIALNEVRAMLSSYKVIGYSVDVGVHEIGPVHSSDQFATRLYGGGGTDMSNAIYRAIEDKLEMAVVLTDGETPWPGQNPHPHPSKFNVVVGVITHQDEDAPVVTHVPEWMEAVHIPATYGT